MTSRWDTRKKVSYSAHPRQSSNGWDTYEDCGLTMPMTKGDFVQMLKEDWDFEISIPQDNKITISARQWGGRSITVTFTKEGFVESCTDIGVKKRNRATGVSRGLFRKQLREKFSWSLSYRGVIDREVSKASPALPKDTSGMRLYYLKPLRRRR